MFFLMPNQQHKSTEGSIIIITAIVIITTSITISQIVFRSQRSSPIKRSTSCRNRQPVQSWSHWEAGHTPARSCCAQKPHRPCLRPCTQTRRRIRRTGRCMYSESPVSRRHTCCTRSSDCYLCIAHNDSADELLECRYD